MKQWIVTLATIICLLGCGKQTAPGWHITVTVLPQKYFVEKLAGEKFAVNVMIPPGHSPAIYEPSSRQMQAVAHSCLYFTIGHLPFEKAWLEKITTNSPQMKVIDTSAGVDLLRGGHDCRNHGHSHAGGNSCSGVIDPHIWLSPAAVKKQAENIMHGLVEVDPGNQKFYQQRYRQFKEEIDQLDRRIKALLQKLPLRKFMVYHPAWGYFARDYQMEQLPLEIEGKEPNPANLRQLIATARRQQCKVIFVQKQFASHNAQTIADEIGAKVVYLDPLAYNWTDNLEIIARALQNALANEVKNFDDKR